VTAYSMVLVVEVWNESDCIQYGVSGRSMK